MGASILGGALYAAAAATYGAWFLREWQHNETLQRRVDELSGVFDVLFMVFGMPSAGRFFPYLLITAQVVFWPAPVICMVVFDVPGYGRNVDGPEGDR